MKSSHPRDPVLSTLATLLVGLALGATACTGQSAPAPPAACSVGGGQGAVSTCLTPQQEPSYYVAQSNKYFDTLDTSASPSSVPEYSGLVARWEWPPWLKLTGYQKDVMISTDQYELTSDPSTVPTRDCQAFSEQPFGRCHVTFQYSSGPCAIYEEFTFNDQGQMTFIEAWTDTPSLSPSTAADRWAERAGALRLSTKVPGLGNATGLIDLQSPWMQAASASDTDVADFVAHAQNFWGSLAAETNDAGPNLYARGCGW